jgi:hypothetical protein
MTFITELYSNLYCNKVCLPEDMTTMTVWNGSDVTEYACPMWCASRPLSERQLGAAVELATELTAVHCHLGDKLNSLTVRTTYVAVSDGLISSSFDRFAVSSRRHISPTLAWPSTLGASIRVDVAVRLPHQQFVARMSSGIVLACHWFQQRATDLILRCRGMSVNRMTSPRRRFSALIIEHN